MKDLCSISDLKVGEKVKLFAICESKSTRKTKNGDLYIDIVIRDKSDSIYSKLWSNVNYFKDNFVEGDVVFVKGKVDTYRKQKQINILSIGKVDEQKYLKYGFSQSLVYRYIDEDLDTIWHGVLSFTSHIKSSYRSNVKRFICNNKNALLHSSNANSPKFQLKGSLVKSLFESLKISSRIWGSYQSINKSVVIISFFLKYVAIAELTSSKERMNEFTLRVNKLCDKYLKTSGIKKILSHSDLNRTNSVFSLGSTKSTNKSEYASIESTLVNEIGDQLRIISTMDYVVSTDETKGDWTSKFNPLRRKLFKG